ncbi:MAG: hypothetical protein ACFB5Z_04930 [Elainellaceae cyanobacterium]
MGVDVQHYKTRQFTEWAPFVCKGALGLMAIALLASLFLPRRVLSERVTVAPEDVATIGPFQPSRSPIGAMRINARAQLPSNSWVTYELQVLDEADNVLASSLKPAWRESGTWQEDGESGTWSEEDVNGRFDIRQATVDSPVTIAISSLEQGLISGQPLSEPITYSVEIWDGAVDRRFLWSGLIGVGILTWITGVAVSGTGRVALSKSIGDSDLVARATVGGPDTLVRVVIKVLSDDTSPAFLTANFALKNDQGEPVYRKKVPIDLSFKRENGRVDSARGQCALNFVIEPEASYGFSVEITPDMPVDRTTLKVTQGARRAGAVEVTHLKMT